MRFRLVITTTLALLLVGVQPTLARAFVTESVAPRVGTPEKASVTVALEVQGCGRCTIQAGQNNRRGSITYLSKPEAVRAGRVELRVPGRRTNRMFFIVDAPYDELSPARPMMVITQFRGRDPGDRITPRYARRSHDASGCWLGSGASSLRNTLVVRKVRVRDSLAGPGRHTVAAGYFTRTLRSQARYYSSPKNAVHPTEANVCR